MPISNFMRDFRINFVLFIIFLFGGVILAKLFFLQVYKQNFYRALAQGQQKIIEEVDGERGEIFFSNESSGIAVNKKGKYLYISPREIVEKNKNTSEVAKAIGNIIGADEKLILEKIQEDSFYTLIKNRLTEGEIEGFSKISFPGVYLGDNVFRYYPQAGLASKVIGFVGADNSGQYGIEEYYDEELKGKKGFMISEKGPKGYLSGLELSKKFAVQKGADIFLTLDYNVQFKSEKLLEEAKKRFNIDGGQIIVIRPESGKILALADFPGFDLNNYKEYANNSNLDIFQNGSTQRMFEPGSVLKPITMAAALDQGKITPETVYTDDGYVKIGGRTVYNYGNRVWGEQTMSQVLEKSINTGAVFAERKIGNDVFLNYLERFGFFEPTHVDLSEVYSENKELKKGYEINFVTASFGQGIEMTPLQLVKAYTAIANGGRLAKPYLVEKIVTDGKEEETKPEISEPIFSPKVSNQLATMLLSVVESGYGKEAKVPGYFIAGKTGTAQVSFSALGVNKEGYSEKTIQSFISFFPAFNPQFLVLVKLDNPETKTAEYSAVPIFRELAEYIINYFQIPPDYE